MEGGCTECVRSCCARYEHRTKCGERTGRGGEIRVKFFPQATVHRLRYDVFYLQVSLGGKSIIPQRFLFWLDSDGHRGLYSFTVHHATATVVKDQNENTKSSSAFNPCIAGMVYFSKRVWKKNNCLNLASLCSHTANGSV